MSNPKYIVVKFSNKRNAYCAKFVGHFDASGQEDSLLRYGDFRGEYAFNKYGNRKQFITAVEKYLNNPNASIERFELDGAEISASEWVCGTILKVALEKLQG